MHEQYSLGCAASDVRHPVPGIATHMSCSRGYLGTDISGDDLLTIIEISGRTFLSLKSSQLRQGSHSIEKHVLTGIKIRLERRNQHVPSHRLGATAHRE